MIDLTEMLRRLSEASSPQDREQIRRELLVAARANALSLSPDKESELLDRIDGAKSSSDREALSAELECLPVSYREFYDRWYRIHEVYALEGWSSEGYDPAKSSWPRDIQLLAATDYGVSDICNGGFSQFFWNDTGNFAPEMIEWFTRSGLHEMAEILRDAMEILGPEYPRSCDVRREFLEAHNLAPQSPRELRNALEALNDRFFGYLPSGQKVFENAADRWLREVCGIQSLRDRPTQPVAE